MSVDTALKKKAATCFLIPHISGVYPQATTGIGPALMMAATWVYPVMATDGAATTGYTSAKPGHLFPLQSALLLENGYYLLLENGDYILLEHQVQQEQAFVSAQPERKFSGGKPTITFS